MFHLILGRPDAPACRRVASILEMLIVFTSTRQAPFTGGEPKSDYRHHGQVSK
jgi:hypothetical protein